MPHDSLVLTAEQTALVAFTADSLPSRWRQRFHSAVSDLLTGHLHPSNADVAAAVSAAKRAICVGIGPVSMG